MSKTALVFRIFAIVFTITITSLFLWWYINKYVFKPRADERVTPYTCSNLGEFAAKGYSAQPIRDRDADHPLEGYFQPAPEGLTRISGLAYFVWNGQLQESVWQDDTLWYRKSPNTDFTGLQGVQWTRRDNWAGSVGLPANERIKAVIVGKQGGKIKQAVITSAGDFDKVYYKMADFSNWQLEPNWHGNISSDEVFNNFSGPHPSGRLAAYSYSTNGADKIREAVIQGGTVWYRDGSNDDAATLPFSLNYQSKPLAEVFAGVLNTPPVDQINSLNYMAYKGVMRQVFTTPERIYFKDCFLGKQALIQNLVNQIDLFLRYYNDPNDGLAEIFHHDYSDERWGGRLEPGIMSLFRNAIANAVASTGRYLVEGKQGDKVNALWILNNTIDRHSPDKEGHRGWNPTWLSYIAAHDAMLVGWIFWDDLDEEHRRKLEMIVMDEAVGIINHIDAAKTAYRNIMQDYNNDFIRVTSLVNAEQKKNPSGSLKGAFITDDGFPDVGPSYEEAHAIRSNPRYTKYFEVSKYINDTSAEDLSAMTGFLAMAAKMFPANPQAARWEEYAKCTAFHAETDGTEGEYCGLRTKNIYKDGRVSNHDNTPNSAYTLASMSGVEYGAFAYNLIGETPPPEFLGHRTRLWNKFTSYYDHNTYAINLPIQSTPYERDGATYYIGHGDWGDVNVKLAQLQMAYEYEWGPDELRNTIGAEYPRLSNYMNSVYFRKFRIDAGAAPVRGLDLTLVQFYDAGLGQTIWVPTENDDKNHWGTNNLADGRGAGHAIIMHLAKDRQLVHRINTTYFPDPPSPTPTNAPTATPFPPTATPTDIPPQASCGPLTVPSAPDDVLTASNTYPIMVVNNVQNAEHVQFFGYVDSISESNKLFDLVQESVSGNTYSRTIDRPAAYISGRINDSSRLVLKAEAVNASGNSVSCGSPLTLTFAAAPTATPTPTPTQCILPKLTLNLDDPFGPGMHTLRWSPVQGATGYRVYIRSIRSLEDVTETSQLVIGTEFTHEFSNNTRHIISAYGTSEVCVGLADEKDILIGTLSAPTPSPTLVVPTDPIICQKSQGDANCDSSVNLADFAIWRVSYIGGIYDARADFNNDQAVNLVDFSVWRRNLQ